MKKATVIFFVIASAILVAALVNNDVFKGWSWQNTNDRVQARAHAQAEWNVQLAERKAVSEQIVASWKIAIPIFWGVASFVVVTLALILIYVMARTGHALVTKSQIWSRSISVDPRTGQLPGYLNNRVFADPNTGLVMTTDKPAAPDRQLAQGAMAIRAAGVVSRNSRNSGQQVVIPAEYFGNEIIKK